jgi:hypothetical protein
MPVGTNPLHGVESSSFSSVSLFFIDVQNPLHGVESTAVCPYCGRSVSEGIHYMELKGAGRLCVELLENPNPLHGVERLLRSIARNMTLENIIGNPLHGVERGGTLTPV